MDIKESNELIAKFMGFINPYGNVYQCCFDNINLTQSPEWMRFHSSWDWLMPALKKVRGIINEDLTIHDFECVREMNLNLNPYDYTIEQVYEAVVEFIKWYNQIKENE